MDTEKNNRSSHFTGQVILGDELTITVEYDAAALVRYLADRTILRILAPEKLSGHPVEHNEQENRITYAVRWKDKQSGADSLQKIARELVEAHIKPEEQKEYCKVAEEHAARIAHFAHIELMAHFSYIAQLTTAEIVEGFLPLGDISASRYDELTHIPLFASKRRGPGGPNRKSKNFNEDEDFKQFFRKTEELRPLWRFITDYFERNDYDAGCAASVRMQERFKELSKTCINVPNNLLKKIFERKASGGEKLSPIAFALEHAYCEIKINRQNGNIPSYWTLKTYYDRGKKLLDIQE